MITTIHGETVCGVDVDPETRCAHYKTDLDIIAIRFKCCGKWFPCIECHRETTDHPTAVWPTGERAETAVLCGACGRQLTIAEYIACSNTCPGCESDFNPGCANHYHLYFE